MLRRTPMPRFLIPLLSAFALSLGVAACDDEAEVETEEGEAEVETE